MRKITISAKYFNSCNDIEKEYIRHRSHVNLSVRGHADISGIKEVLNAARKFFPNGYKSIDGRGVICSNDDKIYMYSGSDTRTFHRG